MQYQVFIERVIRIEQKEEISLLDGKLLQIYSALSETYETLNELLKKNPFDLYLILQVYDQIINSATLDKGNDQRMV